MAIETDLSFYRTRLSELNELRNKFWNEYRAIRNQFLRDFETHSDDPEWQEIYLLVQDMWKSCFLEEMRRKMNMPPARDHAFEPSVVQKVWQGGGLYASERLCVVCKLPLTGRKRLYCSEGCRRKAKSRRWRHENPEAKTLSDAKYLISCYGKDLDT